MDHSTRIVPQMQFEIEKIIGISVGTGNVRTYQVQWAPAWVSGLHLVGCEHLIEEFLQKQQEKDSQENSAPMIVESTYDEKDILSTNMVTAKSFSGNNVNANGNESVNDSRYFDNRTIAETVSHHVTNFTDGGTIAGSTDLEDIKTEDLSDEDIVAESQPLNSDFSNTVRNMNIDYQWNSKHSNHESNTILIPEQPALMDHSEMNFESEHDPTKKRKNGKQNDGGERKGKQYVNGQRKNGKQYDSSERKDGKQHDTSERKDGKPDGKQYDTGDRHECDECGKTFKFKCLLLRHIPVHVGQLRYQCDFCDKSYARKDSHMKHMSTHTREVSSPTDCEEWLPDSDA